MNFLKKLPIVTIIVCAFVFLKFGSKIKEQLNKSAPALGKLVDDTKTTV